MPRKWMGSLLASAALVAIGGWPHPSWRANFAEIYASAVNHMVWHDATFGRGGQARLMALPRPDKPSAAGVTQDAQLQLSIAGRPEKASLGINLRREVYLPLLLFVALVVPAPVGYRRKCGCLLVGVPLLLLLTTLALEGVVVWFFTYQAGAAQVFPSQGVQAHVIDWLFTRLLSPPSHRYLLPVLLAWVGLTYPWQRPMHLSNPANVSGRG